MAALARERCLHRFHVHHVLGNIKRDHRLTLHVGDHAIGVAAVLTEQLGLGILFCLELNVLHNVLLQLYRRQWVALHQGRETHDQVRGDVRIVLLAGKRLELLAVNRSNVLACGIHWRLVGLGLEDAVDVAHVHRLVDAVVRLVHVVHVRRTLRELQLGLRQGNALRCGEDIGVSNRQHGNFVVKVTLLN